MTRAAAATIVLLSAFAQSLSGQADLSTPVSKSGSGDPHQTWTLARGIGSTGNQIDFDQGTAGVWYFMVSQTTEHNPQLYRFIREFNAPGLSNCPRSNRPGRIRPVGRSRMTSLSPAVCFNANDHSVMLWNLRDSTPNGRHASMGGQIQPSWRGGALSMGSLESAGSFADLDPTAGTESYGPSTGATRPCSPMTSRMERHRTSTSRRCGCGTTMSCISSLMRRTPTTSAIRLP